MRGAIFDLDGTVVDNMPLHAEAFAIFAERHGLPPLTIEDRKRLDGRRNKDIFPDLFGGPLDEVSLRAYADEKESLYRELSRGRIALTAGFERLLARLDVKAIPVAIATSAPPENVAHSLRETGLAQRQLTVVRSDQVARGKPFPDVFLAAAASLGVPPSACVAFEDAPIGIEAGIAAGMVTVAVMTSFTEETFRRAPVPPTLVVRDFDDYLAGPGAWLLS